MTGGVSVNISPIDLGINYDTSENAVSVAGGAEIPGGLLGVSGGVTIDLDTGEVTGGSVGAEGLGLGVNISASKDGGLEVGITVQIPFTPIELELGFGFPPKKKEPTPTPAPDPSQPPQLFPEPTYPVPTPGKYCTVYFGAQILNWAYFPYQNQVILEKFQELGSYKSENNERTSGGTGYRRTTYIKNGEVMIESLDYEERSVTAYSTSDPSAPFYISRSYHWGANGFYVHAVSVSGLEENIYRFIKAISLNRQRENIYEKTINQLVDVILGSNCGNTPCQKPPPSPSEFSPPLPFPTHHQRNKIKWILVRKI